jgi:3-hydroxybutyryl-CoA dehydratase
MTTATAMQQDRKVGDIVSETVIVTDEMVQLFAKASGDFNPIHLDEEYAKKTRFGRRIAHGMLSAGLISRVLAMQLGNGIYLSQSLKFLKPVYINDELIITLTIVSLRKERGLASVNTQVKKANGEVCVKGEATIMFGSFI